MTDEHRPRPDDHLVEPMYEALRTEPEPAGDAPARRRGGCLSALLPLVLGASAFVLETLAGGP